ncbi:amino acid adenylation domain-containing protein [Streptomyces sp. NPDC021020]|uniref:amino acid adenylation domain-containing protein n=1 Tax=Streptomyces sp. NPDC021020 TaxID=3365109 RepID=UPI0037B4F223
MTDLQGRIAALPPEKRRLLERRLAERAAARGGAAPERIGPRDRSRPVPTAVQQLREWMFSQFQSETSANNIPGAFRVEGEIDLALVGRVLTEVVERHEVLRTTVERAEDGAWVQVVHPTAPVPTPVVDLSALPAERQQEEVRRRWAAEVAGSFDPAQTQRLRVSLLRMAAETHVVLITTDHAAADLVSVAILIQEFAGLYALHRAGADTSAQTTPALPPPAVQYGDYAAWQRGIERDRTAAELEHWRSTLAGVPGGLALPNDRPYPAEPTFAGAVHTADLSAELSAAVRGFLDDEKASLGVVLIAACSVLLYRYLGQDDVVIGEIRSGRNRPELDRLIGCFVGALPMRMRPADSQTLREVVRQARDTAFTAYDHEDLPFDHVLAQLDLGPEVTPASLMDLWIGVQTPPSTLEVPGLRISAEPVTSVLAMTPLTLEAEPHGDTLRLRWIYMTEMFDAVTVVRLADQCLRILEQICAAPDTPVGQVELAVDPADEAPRAAAPAAAASAGGFVEAFRRRVAIAPHAPAVLRDGVPTSYGDLDRESDRLARRLRSRGVGAETRVGILLDRSPSLAVAVLGVLKAGGAYVPLDPDYPAERIAFMLADAGVEVLITQERPAGEWASAYPTVLLDDPSMTAHGDQAVAPLDAPDPNAPAYVVYTSGSTGRPKGAVIEHHSLATFARDVADRLGLGSGDRFLQFASPGFDVLAEELFPTWLVGGCVVVPARPLLGGGDDLAELIGRERLTVIELPTAFWHEWVRELDRLGRTLPDCLRLVVIGGERVLPERLVAWRRQGVPLLHCYGLTETTVTSTFFRLDPLDPETDWPNLPIGTPLPSADLRVLDHRLRPVPRGAAGELYIGGGSLARGYLGRSGLTALRFLADPDPGRPGGRLYRTGDIVRRRPDGNLEFISRADTQIKIRGYRVEPMEIESVLSRHAQVTESVVTAYEPVPGDRRLVAYVVPRPGAPVDIAELRRFLEHELPGYMTPSAFVELDTLPLNAHGKVDRDRLPAPDGTRPDAGVEYAAPETSVQRTLAEIVAGVVGIAQVGVHDNFFEIGGDSILAIQTIARAQEAGLHLTPFDVFAHPTVAALAEVATAGPAVDAEQGDVSGPVPLAPTQREFCVAGGENPHHWNTSLLAELREPVAPEALAEAVEQLLVHHDGLRQRILLAGAGTRVRIAPRGDMTPFQAYDLSDLDDAGQDRRMAQLARDVQGGLDLAVGPAVRVVLFRLGGRRPDRLALVAHALVADRASLRVLLDDLGTVIGRPDAALPAKTTSWQSWIRRLTARATTEAVLPERGYWAELAAVRSRELPVDSPVEPGADTVATTRSVTGSLDAAETAELLRTLPGALNVRPEELLLAALARTLTAWAGGGPHVVDVERPGREPVFEDVDLSRTVGRFAFAHPVALGCEPDAAPEAVLKTVKEALRAVPSGGIGWLLLRQGADPLPDTAAGVSFRYSGGTEPPAPGGVTVLREGFGADVGPSRLRPYPMEVRVSVSDTGLVVEWCYSESRHRRQTVEHVVDGYLAELRALIGLRGRTGAVHTPSDFPLANVDQAQLDVLLGRL